MLGIYVRLSVEDEESNSIQNQIDEALKYAKLNNYEDSQIIIYNEGEGVKGSIPIKQRSELSRLVQDIKSEKIKIVYTRKQNRISRKLKILDEFLTIIEKYKTLIYFGDKGLLDLSLPASKMVLQVFGAMDEFAPNNQSFETKRSLQNRASTGKIWGRLPYGYISVDGKPVIDEYEASVIRRIYNESLKGSGTRKIAKGLNEDGIDTKSKRLILQNPNKKDYKESRIINNKNGTVVTYNRSKSLWNQKTIYSVLRNRWYIGERTYNGVVYKLPKAIITKKLFNDVQSNLKKNTNNSGKDVKHKYLLKGLLICDKCGRFYNGVRKHNNNKNSSAKYIGNYYGCSSKRSINYECDNFGLSIPMVESFIIKHLLKDKSLIEHLKLVDEQDDSISAIKDDLNSFKEQLKEQEHIRNNIEDLLFKKGIDNTERFQIKLNNTELNIRGLLTKIQNTENLLERKINVNRVTNFKENQETFKPNWNFTQYQTAIKKLVDEIRILGAKDINDKKFFTFKIKYKDFDEYSIFTTRNPYNKWLWLNKVTKTPTQEDLEERERFIELINDTEKGDIKTFDDSLNKSKPEFYISKGDDILINKEDIIEFD
ncbi:hypothetical protein BA195_10065 [Tenacibaculum soleae]|uniref:Resolvase/invertase-type recombinase catalytic domain-containing protein n=1 Tax=Tenacibaculum soleae TaxID=447689 RepID=A0A1B9XYJ6_9FLAO|nr:recombinase family protein [Tenacibaculum soleae]OCK42511.1 hypothetical protein BA195_10065 [Tenacibaculum soleae]